MLGAHGISIALPEVTSSVYRPKLVNLKRRLWLGVLPDWSRHPFGLFEAAPAVDQAASGQSVGDVGTFTSRFSAPHESADIPVLGFQWHQA